MLYIPKIKKDPAQGKPDKETSRLADYGRIPARGGDRAIRSNSSARPGGLPVFPLLSLAREEGPGAGMKQIVSNFA
jgi:hypothetical protein